MADARNNFIPWGLRPLQDFVFKELKDRSNSYGIDYTLDNYNGKNYNGPRTAWVRVCSNARIPTVPEKRRNPKPDDPSPASFREGFIMYGVNGFNDTYGIDNLNNQSKVVLGYDVNGEKHVLDDSENQTFQNRPGPGVTSIESEFYGAGSSFNGLCRKVSIKWRANSIDQLNYMMPYFLSPMMTVVVEWGWNVYNPDSLIDLSEENLGQPADPETNEKGSGLRGYYTNSQLLQEKIEKSNGNYDAFIGRIYDFNFALNRDGTYECTTVVVNTNYMLGGLSTFDISKQENDDTNKQSEILDFRKFVIDDKNLNNMFNLSSFKQTMANFYTSITKAENTGDMSVTLKNIANKAHQQKKLFSNQSEKVKLNNNNIDKKYVKFDVFVELLNYFYSKKFNGGTLVSFIDINDVKICSHPGIKSTDRDVLIPNKYAPKFWKFSKDIGDEKIAFSSQKNITSNAPGDYGKILYELGESVKKQLNDDTIELYYDDLDDLINSGETGREFPQLKNDFGPMGYWGYLKDIYISTELIKTELERNDKYQEFLKAILERINRAAVNIFKFRIIPSDPSENSRITIIDDNYFNNNDDKLKKVAQTPIVIGSTNSSFTINASLDVKLSPQVAAQTLFGNSVYDYRDTGKETVKTEHDGPTAMFVYTDRLFDKTAKTRVVEKVTAESKTKNNTESNVKNFLHVQNNSVLLGTNRSITPSSAILVENNYSTQQFFKDVEILDDDGNVVKNNMYIYNTIMPDTELSLEFLGIAGLRYLDTFTIDGVAEPYTHKKAIWQVDKVNSVVSGNSWKTVVVAKVRPHSFFAKNNNINQSRNPIPDLRDGPPPTDNLPD